MTVQLEGGFRATGMYVSPQNKQGDLEEFLTTTLANNGNENFICGDLNARHCTWDTRCNARGNAVHAVLNRTPNAYINAADVNLYHKITYTKKEHKRIVDTSTPDKGISRAVGAISVVQ